MADLPNIEKNRVVVEGPTGNDLIVNSDGSIVSDVHKHKLANDGVLFGVNAEVNNPSTSERDMLLIKNPSGSGKNLFLSVLVGCVIDTITRFRFRVYVNPTITTNGTSLTIHSKIIKTSPPSTVMEAYYDPTISARGTRIRSYGKADTNTEQEDFKFGLRVEPGNSILITGLSDATNKIYGFSLDWAELA